MNLEVLDISDARRAWARPCLESGGYAEMLWSSGPVWDYLHSNLDFLAKRGWAPGAQFLPLRYFDGIVAPGAQPLSATADESGFDDVLFVGALVFSPRRQSVLDALEKTHGLRVRVLVDTFGAAREAAVRRQVTLARLARVWPRLGSAL